MPRSPVSAPRRPAARTAPAAGRTATAPAADAPASSRAGAPVAATAADPVPFAFFNEVGIIEQLARNRFERVLPQGLSVAQFSVLNHFVRLGGERSLVELARAFQVSKPAMGKLVRKLQEQGLLAVRDDPQDGRGKRVSITAEGEAARAASVRALAPEVARLVEGLGTASFEQLLPGLRRVREWLDANR